MVGFPFTAFHYYNTEKVPECFFFLENFWGVASGKRKDSLPRAFSKDTAEAVAGQLSVFSMARRHSGQR